MAAGSKKQAAAAAAAAAAANESKASSVNVNDVGPGGINMSKGAEKEEMLGNIRGFVREPMGEVEGVKYHIDFATLPVPAISSYLYRNDIAPRFGQPGITSVWNDMSVSVDPSFLFRELPTEVNEESKADDSTSAGPSSRKLPAAKSSKNDDSAPDSKIKGKKRSVKSKKQNKNDSNDAEGEMNDDETGAASSTNEPGPQPAKRRSTTTSLAAAAIEESLRMAKEEEERRKRTGDKSSEVAIAEKSGSSTPVLPAQRASSARQENAEQPSQEEEQTRPDTNPRSEPLRGAEKMEEEPRPREAIKLDSEIMPPQDTSNPDDEASRTSKEEPVMKAEPIEGGSETAVDTKGSGDAQVVAADGTPRKRNADEMEIDEPELGPSPRKIHDEAEGQKATPGLNQSEASSNTIDSDHVDPTSTALSTDASAGLQPIDQPGDKATEMNPEDVEMTDVSKEPAPNAETEEVEILEEPVASITSPIDADKQGQDDSSNKQGEEVADVAAQATAASENELAIQQAPSTEATPTPAERSIVTSAVDQEELTGAAQQEVAVTEVEPVQDSLKVTDRDPSAIAGPTAATIATAHPEDETPIDGKTLASENTVKPVQEPPIDDPSPLDVEIPKTQDPSQRPKNDAAAEVDSAESTEKAVEKKMEEPSAEAQQEEGEAEGLPDSPPPLRRSSRKPAPAGTSIARLHRETRTSPSPSPSVESEDEEESEEDDEDDDDDEDRPEPFRPILADLDFARQVLADRAARHWCETLGQGGGGTTQGSGVNPASSGQVMMGATGGVMREGEAIAEFLYAAKLKGSRIKIYREPPAPPPIQHRQMTPFGYPMPPNQQMQSMPPGMQGMPPQPPGPGQVMPPYL